MSIDNVFNQIEEYAINARITKEMRVIAKEEYAAGFTKAKKLALEAVLLVPTCSIYSPRGETTLSRDYYERNVVLAAIRAIEPETKP